MNELKSYNELSYKEKKRTLHKAAEGFLQEDFFKEVEVAFLVQNYGSILKGIDRDAENYIRDIEVLVNNDSHIGIATAEVQMRDRYWFESAPGTIRCPITFSFYINMIGDENNEMTYEIIKDEYGAVVFNDKLAA